MRSARPVRSVFVLSAVSLALPLMSSAAAAAPDDIDAPATATAAATRLDNQYAIAEPPPPPQPQTVQYRVSFFSEWTSSSHPTTLPGNAHFSPIVVATHSTPGALFVRGALASPGIELMAERGTTSTLRSELAANSSVTSSALGSSIFGAGSNTFTVTLTQDASLVSLVSMLAPSPDWFVGVRDTDMFVDEVWVDSTELDLANYDAGTDSGAFFSSGNSDTNPAQVISGSRDVAFSAAIAEGRFGRVVIERL